VLAVSSVRINLKILNTTIMKKIFVFASVAFFAACNSGTDTAKVDSMKSGSDSSKMDNLNYPYTAEYSSKFEIGDPNNSMTVLNLYKAWDNNTLDDEKNLFADFDTLNFSDGSRIAGSRDSVLAAAKQFRNTMSSVTSVVQAFTPLKSTDKNENWVVVWFKELRTATNGKKDSSYFQETWRLNKDGKVDLLYQYEAKTAPPAKK
jgi:hypothetical protein